MCPRVTDAHHDNGFALIFALIFCEAMKCAVQSVRGFAILGNGVESGRGDLEARGCCCMKLWVSQDPAGEV